MGGTSITVDTTADATAAFDYVADPTNEPRWNPDAKRSELVNPGPIAPGTQVRTIGSMGGREMIVAVTVETLDRPRRTTTHASAGRMRFRTVYDVSRTAFGSRVTMTVSISATGPLRVLEPLLRTGFARRLRRLQPVLKTALDSL